MYKDGVVCTYTSSNYWLQAALRLFLSNNCISIKILTAFPIKRALCLHGHKEDWSLSVSNLCLFAQCLKTDFVFSLALEIQLLSMLILGADFLCWLAERTGGSLFPFPKCWPCKTWQAQRGHSDWRGDNHQLPLQELGWSFKTINHLSDLLTGVLTEKAKYANSRVWTFSFSILNDVSVAMSLCWSAVKGKNGILNTEMLGVPG